MFGLLVLVALGAVFFFVVPSIIPVNYKSAATANLARALGILFILFAIASTSFVFVPDGHVGHLFRVYGGGPLTEGRIVAANGENGPQAEIFTPGFHARFLLNVIYNVETGSEEVNIPQGKVAILTARDGAPLRSGQAFADPFLPKLGYQMLDAATFINNGGQRGPQLTVLTPGKWRINRYLWDVAQVDAKEVKAGYVGVVKSNVNADIDFGTLKAAKPTNCDVIINKDVSAGRLDAPIVPVGCIGVWKDALPPGKYYFPPDAFLVTEIDTRAQVWSYAGGYKRSNITLTVDSKGDIVQSRTEENVPGRWQGQRLIPRGAGEDGKAGTCRLELQRGRAGSSPSDASCVVAGVGTLRDIEDQGCSPPRCARSRATSRAAPTRSPRRGSMRTTSRSSTARASSIFVTINRPTKVL